MSIAQAGVLAITLVCAVTLAAGALGLRISRTTSDFYVAGRSVSAAWNASAIGGEYLSAASFLGISGAIALSGNSAELLNDERVKKLYLGGEL